MSRSLPLGGPLTADLRGRRVVVVGTGPLPPLVLSALTAAQADIHRVPQCAAADLAEAWLVVWIGPDGPQSGADVRRLADDARLLFVDGGPSGDSPDDGAGGRGRVILVGGGPGDPGLLTLRGWQALNDADVVVVDRLAPLGVLAGLDPRVEVIDVGKEPLRHPVPQEQIQDILITRARRGQTVVRLKGGDPYLLGRGGEEVLACRAAGVEVEVVPGITSALSGPAAAGIPVTHRGLSRAVTVMSGHEPPDYPALAALDGTIVLLMGMGRLHELTAGLVGAGMAPGTPAAVVQRAWTPRQKVVWASVGTIARRCAAEQVSSPAVIVIGEVARGLHALAADAPSGQAAATGSG